MSSSADALYEAARAAQPGYALEAFRAPGLCAQPFAAVAAGMRALGSTIDSSVAPGGPRYSDPFVRLPPSSHRRVPALRRRSARTEPDGPVRGLPVTCTVEWLATKVLRRIDKIRRPAQYEAFGDGTWMPTHTKLRTRLRNKLLPSVSAVGLEGTPPSVMRRVLSHADRTVTFISHPKAMSPVSFESLRSLAEQGVRFALPAEVVADHCSDRRRP